MPICICMCDAFVHHEAYTVNAAPGLPALPTHDSVSMCECMYELICIEVPNTVRMCV